MRVMKVAPRRGREFCSQCPSCCNVPVVVTRVLRRQHKYPRWLTIIKYFCPYEHRAIWVVLPSASSPRMWMVSCSAETQAPFTCMLEVQGPPLQHGVAARGGGKRLCGGGGCAFLEDSESMRHVVYVQRKRKRVRSGERAGADWCVLTRFIVLCRRSCCLATALT